MIKCGETEVVKKKLSVTVDFTSLRTACGVWERAETSHERPREI